MKYTVFLVSDTGIQYNPVPYLTAATAVAHFKRCVATARPGAKYDVCAATDGAIRKRYRLSPDRWITNLDMVTGKHSSECARLYGSTGGRKSRRVLTGDQARGMVRVRERKRVAQ